MCSFDFGSNFRALVESKLQKTLRTRSYTLSIIGKVTPMRQIFFVIHKRRVYLHIDVMKVIFMDIVQHLLVKDINESTNA